MFSRLTIGVKELDMTLVHHSGKTNSLRNLSKMLGLIITMDHSMFEVDLRRFFVQ